MKQIEQIEAVANPQPAYTPPVLRPLGPWHAVTLAQSVPISPGGLLHLDLDPDGPVF